MSRANSKFEAGCALVEYTPTKVPFFVLAVTPCKSPAANAKRYEDIRGVVANVQIPVAFRFSISISGIFESAISPAA